jgi:DNA-binding CsgD family transcriptional regulator
MVLSASHDTKVYDAESRDALHRRMRQPDLVDPFELLGRRGVADAGQSAVWRAGHLSDHEWYNSVYYNEFARHLRLDDRIQITRQIGDRGLVHSVSFCRATGDPKFDERALQLGSLAIDSMSLLRKWSISSGTVFDAARRAGAVAEETRAIDTDGVELTPKLKEVLELLLQGDSEKQIALKLKRSIHTVHTHVKRLHKAYDVSSRGELFARFLKR